MHRVTLPVEVLIAQTLVGLLRLRIVEESIRILELALRHSLEDIEHHDLAYLEVDVLLLALQKHPLEVVLGQYGRYTLLRHDVARGISRVVRDEGILSKALPLDKLIDMLHDLHPHRYLVFLRLGLADTASRPVLDSVFQLTHQPLAEGLELATLPLNQIFIERGILGQDLRIQHLQGLDEFDEFGHPCELQLIPEQVEPDDLDHLLALFRCLIFEDPYILKLLENVLVDIPRAIHIHIDLAGHSNADGALQDDEKAVAIRVEFAEDLAFRIDLVDHDLIHLHLVLSREMRSAPFRDPLHVVLLLDGLKECHVFSHVVMNIFVVARCTIFVWFLEQVSDLVDRERVA